MCVTPCHAHAMPCSAMPCHVQACGATCRAMPTLHGTAAAHPPLPPRPLLTAHVQAKDATVTFKDIAGIDQVRLASLTGGMHFLCWHGLQHGRHGKAA